MADPTLTSALDRLHKALAPMAAESGYADKQVSDDLLFVLRTMIMDIHDVANIARDTARPTPQSAGTGKNKATIS